MMLLSQIYNFNKFVSILFCWIQVWWISARRSTKLVLFRILWVAVGIYLFFDCWMQFKRLEQLAQQSVLNGTTHIVAPYAHDLSPNKCVWVLLFKILGTYVRQNIYLKLDKQCLRSLSIFLQINLFKK